MKRKSQLLYKEMLLRIGSLLTSGYSEQQWIEKGFHASYLSFFNLQQIAGTHHFTLAREKYLEYIQANVIQFLSCPMKANVLH